MQLMHCASYTSKYPARPVEMTALPHLGILVPPCDGLGPVPADHPRGTPVDLHIGERHCTGTAPRQVSTNDIAPHHHRTGQATQGCGPGCGALAARCAPPCVRRRTHVLAAACQAQQPLDLIPLVRREEEPVGRGRRRTAAAAAATGRLQQAPEDGQVAQALGVLGQEANVQGQ